jgi:hypothetical protein
MGLNLKYDVDIWRNFLNCDKMKALSGESMKKYFYICGLML